jgi:hypothetical protein
MKFRVMRGIHVQGGKVYQGIKYNGQNQITYPGDIVDTEENLAATFVNKFQRVVDDEPTNHGRHLNDPSARVSNIAVSIREEQERKQADLNLPQGNFQQFNAPLGAPPAKPVVQAPVIPDGLDVTTRFPKANEQLFKVYKRDKKYFVYDEDNMLTPLNADGVDKVGVDELVKNALQTA